MTLLYDVKQNETKIVFGARVALAEKTLLLQRNPRERKNALHVTLQNTPIEHTPNRLLLGLSSEGR